MQAFLEFVVKGLVQHPDEATVTPVERNGMTIYELRLNPAVFGGVGSKGGDQRDRSLLLAVARVTVALHLEIVEDKPRVERVPRPRRLVRVRHENRRAHSIPAMFAGRSRSASCNARTAGR